MTNTVQIRIFNDPSNPTPTLLLPNVPWYAGITALQAMIIGEAMYVTNFSFRVLYQSIYGAQIDSIDGLSNGDQPQHYWILWIDGVESQVGASEAIMYEDATKTSVTVDWKYTNYSAQPLPAKLAPLSGRSRS